MLTFIFIRYFISLKYTYL